MANKKYAQEVADIIVGFYGEAAKDWLKNNGLGEEARYYLLQMENAGNDKDFNDAKDSFKNNIMRPFYEGVIVPAGNEVVDAFLKTNPWFDYASAKSLGSYEDIKKNEKIQNSKYATRSVNDKGETVVNVPLLRVVNDPSELNILAEGLHVSPEDLRDHVMNEWNKKKKREWVEEEKSMRNAIVDGGKVNGVVFPGRKGVVKEYDKNFWSGVLKTVAPELYAGMRRDIAEGKGESGSVLGWVGEHAKDAGLDAVRSGAVAIIPNITSNPIVTGIGVGTAGLASLAGSSYYPVNSDNVKTELMAGLAAGTIPSGVGMVLSKLSAAGAGWRQAARKAMRAIQRGEDLPSVNEQNLINKSVDDAYFIYEAYRNGDYSKTGGQVRNAIQKVCDMLNKSPRTVGKDFTIGEVGKMLTSKEGVMEIKSLLQAPSKKTFVNWNAIAENGQFFSDAEYKAAKEAVRRTDELFPETFSEITAPEIAGLKQKIKDVAAITLGNAAEKYGSYAEPLRQRRDLKEGLNTYESSNPEQVEAWKRYGIPSWDPLAEEFNEKYGEGR